MGLVVDIFAGGGGASLGLERAGLDVDIAVNHDPEAIAMHAANHPRAKHYACDIWEVKPRVATGCRPARDALGRPPAAPARRAPEASVTPITVTRDAPTLSAVLAAVGWRRTDGVVYDEDGAPVCALWWQAWAALYERGILAPDDEMRASCERHAAQARAWS